jgi:outer membrane protein insertion porin family
MDRTASQTSARRAPAFALSLLVAAAACSRPAPRSALEPARVSACSAKGLPAAAGRSELPVSELPSEPIAGLDVRGATRTSAELVREALEVRPGERLDPERLAAGLRRIWQLEVFEDVRLGVRDQSGRPWLVVQVTERPTVADLETRGPVQALAELGVERGALYEPARLYRRARELERSLAADGFRRAKVSLSGVRRDDTVELCATVETGPRLLLERVEFAGNERINAAELRSVMHTASGKVNTPGAPYRPDVLERDLLEMKVLYYDRGMLAVKIAPELEEDARALALRLEVSEGPVYRIGQLAIRGELVAPRRRYQDALGTRTGDVFSRKVVAEGIERIAELHRALRRGDLVALPVTELHPDTARVDLVLEVVRN